MKRLISQFVITFLAVGLALAGYEYYNKKNVTNFIENQTKAIHLTQSLMLASPVKVAIAEYYLYGHKWPASNSDLQLPHPNSYRTLDLEGLEVVKDGVITLFFSENFGWGKGTIKLIPHADKMGNISWECISNSFENINSAVASCKYRSSEKHETEMSAQKPKSEHLLTKATPEPDTCQHSGFVVNPLFSSEIKNRLPHRVITRISPQTEKVIHFSEIVALKSSRVDFRWYQNGSLVKKESIDVESPRWRVWSESEITPSLGDELTVEIFNGNCLLFRDQRKVQTPSADQTDDVLLDESPDIFGDRSQANLISHELYSHMHKDRFSIHPKFYFIDSQGNLRIDYSTKRDRSAHDFFSELVAGNKSAGEFFLGEGINRRNHNGDTPLIEAIKAGSEQTLSSFLKLGADPFIRDRQGFSPLDLSQKLKRHDFSQQIYKQMQNLENVAISKNLRRFVHNYAQIRGIDNRNRLGETQLMRAAANGNEYALIYLASKKSETEKPITNLFYLDYSQRDAIEIAKEGGYLGAQFILEELRSKQLPPWTIHREAVASAIENQSPNNCNLNNAEQLIWIFDLVGVAGRKAEISWYLDEKNAQLLKVEKFNISENQQRIISKIDTEKIPDGESFSVKLKVDDILVDRDYYTRRFSRSKQKGSADCTHDFRPAAPLFMHHLQAWTQSDDLHDLFPDSVEYLTRHNTDKIRGHIVNTESYNGLKFLLEKGVSVYYYDAKLMQSAIQQDKHAIAAMLVSHGFNIKEISKYRRQKYSAVFDAVYRESKTMIKFLHQQGESMDDPWHDGRTPLVAALSNCNKETIALLLELGANVDAEYSEKSDQAPISIRDYAKKCFYDPEILTLFEALPTK